MATRSKVVDWNKVKAILSKEDFSVASEQRARHLELSRVLSLQVPKIDFSQYKQALQNQDIVSQVEQAIKGFSPAKTDVSPILKQLDQQKQEALKSAKETVAEVERNVATFKKDLESIKELPHYDHLTVDAVYEAAPGLEKVYHDRLSEGKVFHDDHNFGTKFIG